MTLGEIIKKYRKEHGLSMADFANLSGLSKAYVSLLEKNKNPKTNKPITPSIDMIKKVSDAIGKDFNDVFNQIDGEVILTGSSNSKSNNEDNHIPQNAFPYDPGPTVRIPIVGSVNCGDPLLAEDNIEGYIETPAEDMVNGGIYFWLRARGDSMINVGIHEGDLLLIRKQDDVNSGDIAVVAINGDEATLKRVIKKENAIVLQPENSNYETKVFVGREMEDIDIRGRLMEMKKKF